MASYIYRWNDEGVRVLADGSKVAPLSLCPPLCERTADALS